MRDDERETYIENERRPKRDEERDKQGRGERKKEIDK